MQKRQKITGIILCGGKSKRMGTNKALLKLNGKFVIQYVVDVLNIFCDEILLSANSKELEVLNIPIIRDEFSGIGPIAGIYSTLKQSNNAINIILSCDTPFINEGFVRYLLDNANNYDVVLPVFENHLQPMTGIFNKNIAHHILNEIKQGNYIPPRIFEKVGLNKIKIDENLSFWHKYLFFNINRPEEYLKAQEIIKNC